MRSFDELELIMPLRRALSEADHWTPTAIQSKSIPPALLGQDLLGCAQTGTGKTAAFALPILDRLGRGGQETRPHHPRALILSPTRELAVQISDSFATYGKYLRLRRALVYGGVSPVNQVRELKRGAHIVIATPGRLLDLINQRHLCLDDLQVFVLDEVDRMLDAGFLPDLKSIVRKLPSPRQSLFFSATLPPQIVELARRLLHNPICVNVVPKLITLEAIDQSVMFLEKGDKVSALQSLLCGAAVTRALVFTRTKRGASNLADKLGRCGIKATAIHGNQSQNGRQRALAAFRNDQVRVLVATDVVGRGIDIGGITHVINFDLPEDPESYVHRIGRTGRNGASGAAVSFCSHNQRPDLRAIERLIGQTIRIESQRHHLANGHDRDNVAAGSSHIKQRGPATLSASDATQPNLIQASRIRPVVKRRADACPTDSHRPRKNGRRWMRSRYR